MASAEKEMPHQLEIIGQTDNGKALDLTLRNTCRPNPRQQRDHVMWVRSVVKLFRQTLATNAKSKKNISWQLT